MKIFKALLPIFTISLLALYAREHYSLVPLHLSNALQYLPVLLILLITSVSIYFNQTKILLSVLLISFLYFCSQYNWVDTPIKLSTTATFVPLLILLTQLLKKQSIISVRSLPVYVIYVFFILFSLWIIEHQPIWATEKLFVHWLPEKYFDWSPFPQIALSLYFIVFLCLLILFSKKQNSRSATSIILLFTTYIILQPLNSNDTSLLVTAIMLLYLVVLLQESRKMAYIDELTLLPGRRALQEKLQGLVGIYTIAMVDIDFFKKFNDKYGHDTGDEVLRMIAAKLGNVKGGGTAYRYGGEEFTIVFGNKSSDQTIEYLEQLREDIAKTKFVVNRRTKTNKNLKKASVIITVSIGMADSIDISSAGEVIKQADIALYKAKKKGRNCIS